MPTTVKIGDNGPVVSFPDGMNEAQILQAIRSNPQTKTWAKAEPLFQSALGPDALQGRVENYLAQTLPTYNALGIPGRANLRNQLATALQSRQLQNTADVADQVTRWRTALAISQDASELGITPEAARQQGVPQAVQSAQAAQAEMQYQQDLKDFLRPHLNRPGVSPAEQGSYALLPAQAREINRNVGALIAGTPLSQTPPTATGALLNRALGSGTNEALGQQQGYQAGLTRGLLGLAEPGNLLYAGAAAPVSLLGPVGQSATLGAFAAPVAQQAYQRAQTGDIGGALGELTAFILPMAAHAVPDLMANARLLSDAHGLEIPPVDYSSLANDAQLRQMFPSGKETVRLPGVATKPTVRAAGVVTPVTPNPSPAPSDFQPTHTYTMPTGAQIPVVALGDPNAPFARVQDAAGQTFRARTGSLQPLPPTSEPTPAPSAPEAVTTTTPPVTPSPAPVEAPVYDNLQHALGAGLQQTNGFGSYRLSDGSLLPTNPISRSIGADGNLMAGNGDLVDPASLSEVRDQNGKLLWRNENAPQQTPPPESPVSSSQPQAAPGTPPPFDSVVSSILPDAAHVAAQLGMEDASPELLQEVAEEAARREIAQGLHSQPAETTAVAPTRPADVTKPETAAKTLPPPAETPSGVSAESSSGTASEPRYAANLRLDKLNSPEEVKAAVQAKVREMATEIQAARGGTISQEETAQAAKDLGLTANTLQGFRPGQKAAYTLAVRQLLVDSAQGVRDAETTYQATPTEENLGRLQMASKQYQTVLLSAAGNAAEAGRALNSYKILADAFAGDPAAAAEKLFEPKAEPVYPKSPRYGTSNTLFTKAAADAARVRLQGKLGNLNAGIDPTLLKDLLEVGGYHLEAGLRSFGDWLSQMQQVTGGKVSDADLRDVWNQLKDEAKNRAQAAQQPKEVLRRRLLEEHSADAARLVAKLASIAPDDIAGLNKVMREEAKIGLGSQVLAVRKAGLLSSPRTPAKVILSHGAFLGAEELAKLPAAITDALLSIQTGQRTATAPRLSDVRQATLQAATRGIREAGMILQKGEAGAEQAGMPAIGTRAADLFGDVHTKSPLLDSYINAITRMHGAAYRPFKVYALTRALQEQARVTALNEGLKGEALQSRVTALLDHPTPQMSADAIEATEVATFLNDNKGTQAFAAAKYRLGLAGTLLDFAVPITKVPVNIVARMLEYAFGVPASLAKAGADKLAGADFNQQKFAQTFGRGAVGLSILGLGYLAAKQGHATGVTPGGSSDRPEGAVNLGGRWYEMTSIAPIGTLFSLGATLAEAEGQENPPVKADALRLLQEQPYLRAAQELTDTRDATGKAFVGNAVGSFVPTAISDLAAQLDSVQRQKSGPADYVKNRLPGFRQTLPETGRQETNKLYDPFNSRPGEAGAGFGTSRGAGRGSRDSRGGRGHR